MSAIVRVPVAPIYYPDGTNSTMYNPDGSLKGLYPNVMTFVTVYDNGDRVYHGHEVNARAAMLRRNHVTAFYVVFNGISTPLDI